MKKQHLLLFIFLASSGTIFCQDSQVRRYATQTYMRQMVQNDSTYKGRAEAIEQHTFRFRYFGTLDTVVIPVVFHIVGSNVSEQDILAQLERLNTDFFTPEHPYLSDDRYQNPDAKEGNYGLTYMHPADQYENYAQRAAPPMIRFCLPALDPEGNPTNGIISVASSVTEWAINNAVKNNASGGSTPWNTQRYCNVWIAPLAEHTAGYAQQPGGPVETDGIVISPQYFLRSDGTAPTDGTADFALGRTLVHLMGNYLNLYDLWNEKELCGDDLVDDTPIHNAPNFGKGEYKHVSTCGNNPIEMTMNLMDCGSDSSMYMFTWGQAVRMQATLAEGGPRNSLTYTGTACETDGGGFAASETRSNKNQEGSFRLNVIPNPNSGDFMLEIEPLNDLSPEINAQLFNASGTMVWEKILTHQPGGLVRIPVTGRNWSAGIYTLLVVNGAERQVKKVVIR